MALGATMVWRVRAGGASANGGGFDPAVSGAGTDYTDQDSPQLSPSDLATSGVSATITSVSGGFTSAMVGNVIRIPSGTNFTPGYYTIITYTNTNTIVVDRNCATGVGALGIGKIGGAFAKINQFAIGGNGTQPTLTSPLAAGHTVYVRGNGSDNPSSADYNHDDGYLIFQNGDTTSGMIRFIGYNGRPLFTTSNALISYGAGFQDWSNLAFVASGNVNGSHGFIEATDYASNVSVRSCIANQAGNDCVGVSVNFVVGNWFKNTGSTSAGTAAYAAITNSGAGPWASNLPGLVDGNLVTDWRGGGINSPSNGTCKAINNIISGTRATGCGGIDIATTAASKTEIFGNIVYNCAGDGIKIGTGSSIVPAAVIMNNICANNAGYGINMDVGSAALNDRTFNQPPDYNCLYGNGSGAYRNVSAGAHDSSADPQFVNAAGGNFAIGTNLKGLGFPQAFLSGLTTSYLDMGAVQRQEPASGMLFIPDLAGT